MLTQPLSIPSLSSSLTYSRTSLLSLAQTPLAQPPSPSRLNSFSSILRRGTLDPTEWGVDEEHSSILDGQPVSKALPIPALTNEGDEAKDVLFAFKSSMPRVQAAPVGIFTNPEPFALKREGPHAKASSVFQALPATASSTTLGSNTGVGVNLALSLGEKYTSLRRHSRSSSPCSVSSMSSDPSSNSASLNPFAAPWPLPAETPDLSHPPSTDDIPSLPLPNNLPSSLPPRPVGPVAPVFVKRESAALPQPMALPDIAPLGEEWEGESALSGNEISRRRSGVVNDGGGGGRRRPERLIKLGERLRRSVAGQGM